MLTARRRPTGDAGTSLAELVVCMALTTVVGAMALSFFLWTGRSTNATTASSFTLQTSRIAMSTVTGAIRLAQPGTVVATSPDNVTKMSSAITFNASDALLAGCPARPASTITVIVTGGTVRLDRTGPQNAPVAGNPCRYLTNQLTSRTLVTGVQAAGTGFVTVDGSSPARPTVAATAVAAVTFVLAVTGTGAQPQTYRATAVVSGTAS